MHLRTIVMFSVVAFLASCGQSRTEALDMLCNAPSTCGAACENGDARARLDAMRAHLDGTIKEESVQQIYREYWAGADRSVMDTMARAAMREERGRDDCAYFDWFMSLGPAEAGE